MRKLLFILTALIAFSLGLASQNLIAGGSDPNYVYPAENSHPPDITSNYSTFYNDTGWAIYKVPDGWKLVGYNSTNLGNVAIQLKKRRD